MSHVSPCSNCRQPTTKTVLKDQIWQVNRSGALHRVLVPEFIVSFCVYCCEYTIGCDGDEQIEKALEVHLSKPCEC